MIGIDQDIHVCSNAASFVIALATEMFIQYLAEQGHNVVKSERKPRRNIQYRDLSNAIAHLDNLEFLIDVVPKTVPFKEIKEKKAGPSNSAMINGDSSIEVGQTTLDGKKGVLNGTNGFGNHGAGPVVIDDDEGDGPADPNAQLEMEIRRANRKSIGSPSDVNGAGGEDVEMH